MSLQDLLGLQQSCDQLRAKIAVASQTASNLASKLKQLNLDLAPREDQLAQATKSVADQNERLLELQKLAGLAGSLEQQIAANKAQLDRVDSLAAALRGLESQFTAAIVPLVPLRAILTPYLDPAATRLPDELANRIKSLQTAAGSVMGVVPRTQVVAARQLAETWHGKLTDQAKQRDQALTESRNAAAEFNTAASLLASLQQRQRSLQAAIAPLEQERVSINAQLTQQGDAITLLRQQLRDASSRYQAVAGALLASADASVPLALFPVRIEAHFDTAKSILKIRVFPDDLHDISHSPKLTAYEARCAQVFWTAGRTQAAWTQLAGLFGPERAAWIWRVLEGNGGLVPAAMISGDADESASLPPYTDVLPDCWVALGYRAGKRAFAKWGRVIPDPLDLLWEQQSNETVRWKSDFDEAVRLGMGLEVDLTPAAGEVTDPAVATDGLDLLVVLGVKAGLDASQSSARLSALLDAHHYTWGLGLLSRGTPSNNTEEIRSGFTTQDANFAQSWALESQNQLLHTGAVPLEGERVARALGIPVDAFAHVAGAGQHDDYHSAAMNRALWPATWGYFLRHVMSGDPATGSRFTPEEMDQFSAFFRDWVRPGGPYLTLRVGEQPYGLLPVSSLDRWQPWSHALTVVSSPAGSRLHVGSNLNSAAMVNAWSDRAQILLAGIAPMIRSLNWAVVKTTVPDRARLLGLRVVASTPAERAEGTMFDQSLSAAGGAATWVPVNWPQEGSTACAAHTVARFDPTAPADVLVVRFVQGATNAPTRAELLSAGGLVDDIRQLQWRAPVALPLGQIQGVVEAASISAAQAGLRTEFVLVWFVVRTPDGKRTVQAMIGRGLMPSAWTQPAPIPAVPLIAQAAADAVLRGIQISVVQVRPAARDVLVLAALWRAGAMQASLLIGRGLDAQGAVHSWDVVQPMPLIAPDATVTGLALVSVEEQKSLAPQLLAMRKKWLEAVQSVPRCTPQSADPDADMLHVLGMEPASRSVFARDLTSVGYVGKLKDLLNPQFAFESWAQKFDKGTADARARFGIPWRLLTDDALFREDAHPLQYALVTAASSSPTVALAQCPEGDYIGGLLKQSLTQLHDSAAASPAAQDPLLLRLLRHGLIWECMDATFKAHPVVGHVTLEPAVVDYREAAPTFTPWRYLQAQGLSLYELARNPSPPQPAPPGVLEIRAKLQQLSGLSTSLLESLLMEELDSCSHRLDAWITALASQRIEDLRRTRPTGIGLGCYGWVENIRPSQASAASKGFVHAPSDAHAVTAAILRSGFLSHDPSGQGAGLAVNLSSNRARLANELLAAVGGGQPIGAVLGYRFERGLHENCDPKLGMEQYIAPLRALCPLVAGKLTPLDGTSVDAVSAGNVVDGFDLLTRYRKGQIPFGTGNLPALNDQQGKALTTELDRLVGMADAVADALLCESVLHAARGNPLRSGASLDALSRGEAPPAELQILSTPRSAADVTHRMLIVFPDGGQPSVDASKRLTRWQPQESQPRPLAFWPRASAAPALNLWAASLLPDPESVIFRVQFEYTQDGTQHIVPDIKPLRMLSEIEVCPLDLIYMLPAQDTGQQGEIEQRIAYLALTRWRPSLVPDAAHVRITFDRDSNDDAHYTIPEVLEIARVARDVIVGSRALSPDDLRMPAESEAAPAQVAWSQADRSVMDGVLTSFAQQLSELSAPFAVPDPQLLAPAAKLLPDGALQACKHLFDLAAAGADLEAVGRVISVPADLDNVRWVLMKLAAFGIVDALPRSLAGAQPEQRGSLLVQACSIYQRASLAFNEARQALDQNNIALAVEKIFGKNFRVMPPVDGATWSSVSAVLGKAAKADAVAIQTWLARVARVREAAGRFSELMAYAEALQTGDQVSRMVVGQLPAARATNDWVSTATRPSGGEVSLAVHAPFGIVDGVDIRGLFVDDWIERVPSATERTYLTFDYDAPTNCAPQTVLLAVPPNPCAPWDLDTLESVLRETLDLTKIRAVDYQALTDGGQIFPILYFAFNSNNDTISVDLHAA